MEHPKRERVTMEKPRKMDIPVNPLIPKLAFDAHPIIEAMGYNKGIDAMSTWIEGEVKKIRELTDYPEEPNAKNMNEDLVWDYKERLDKIHALITRKLTGKV